MRILHLTGPNPTVKDGIVNTTIKSVALRANISGFFDSFNSASNAHQLISLLLYVDP